QRFSAVVTRPQCGHGGGPCCADDACDAPYVCGPDGYCRLGSAGDPCESGDDCIDHRCAPGGACRGWPAACTAHEHCWTAPQPDLGYLPERCGSAGYCITAACMSDADCMTAQQCVTGPFGSYCETHEAAPCTSSGDCAGDDI